MSALAFARSKLPIICLQQATVLRPISTTTVHAMPMKPGTPIPGLDIYKDKDPPVALERSEYPEWLGSLHKPLISLAKLRKLPFEEASDKEVKRYLKLVRRMKIKANNEASKKR